MANFNSIVKISTPLSKKLLGAALLLSFLASACEGNQPSAQNDQSPAVSVKLQTLEQGTIENRTEFLGNLEAKERVTLIPRIDGRIMKIFVSEGDKINRGAPIVELQPTKQQQEVNAAVSSVNLQREKLKVAQAELKAAKAEQARVDADVERAKRGLEDAEAEVALAESNFKRSEVLVAQGAQSQQDLDQKQLNLNTKIAQRDSQQESLNTALKALQKSQEQLKQALASVDGQKAAALQAEARLQAQGELGSRTKDLQVNRVVAPISGVVGNFSLKVGDYINVGQELTTITRNDLLELNINVPVENKSKLKLGLPVELVDTEGSTKVTGKIDLISPTVDQQTQTILAKATFPNEGSLRDDEYVKARVIWDSKPGILIPTESVSRIDGQKFVFVAQPGESPAGEPIQVVKQTSVELGDIQGEKYQVLSGLEAGEKIAVSDILNLRDGVPIAPESLKSENSETNKD
ncbi:MAG: efflux RND transporter periplasmic adaptor subunit [Symploca sp. SIO2E9]|nr:efflux RND transporter periplasmic adaptor subunit [Symploca sp. SIO2E9]